MHLTLCLACQAGDHAHHQRVLQPVQEGVMGGAECRCEGECVRPASERYIEGVTGPFKQARPDTERER
jgi:hypothetical protein